MTTSNAPFFVDNEVILLNSEGVWIADGHEITHEPTRKLFARSLALDEKGWFLKIGRETKHILVQDTPYFVMRLGGSPRSGWVLKLNDETEEPLELEGLSYKPGRLAVKLKRGIEAKFLRGPYFELLRDLEEDDAGYWLESKGARVLLARK